MIVRCSDSLCPSLVAHTYIKQNKPPQKKKNFHGERSSYNQELQISSFSCSFVAGQAGYHSFHSQLVSLPQARTVQNIPLFLSCLHHTHTYLSLYVQVAHIINLCPFLFRSIRKQITMLLHRSFTIVKKKNNYFIISHAHSWPGYLLFQVFTPLSNPELTFSVE